MRPRSFVKVWSDWAIAFLKYVWNKLHTPFGVWMIVIWVSSILIMGFTAMSTADDITFTGGPNYWLKVFLTYGLNGGQEIALRFVSKPFIEWIFAPMVSIVLGIILFILPESGFFRNGLFPTEELDFEATHKFFSITDIWGSGVNTAHPKWTNMYLWIVFMPIVIGTVVAGFYNFIMFKLVLKRKHLPKAKNMLIWNLIATLIVGIQMALMTGDIVLRFSGILRSLFVERKTNNFIEYGLVYGGEGQYHPIGLAFTMWLVNMIPFLLVYLTLMIIGNLDVYWQRRDFIYRRVKLFINERKTIKFDASEQA
ncbi:hypothetical protein ES705_34612 [subsurface metagenome]